MPEPEFLTTETSEGMRRALRRCGRRVSDFHDLALERLNEWSLPDQLYTNVVELIASEMEREEEDPVEAVPPSLISEQQATEAAESLGDLIESLAAGPAASANAEVLLELMERENEPEEYGSLATSLEVATEAALDLRLYGLARMVVGMLQNHAGDSSGPEWRRRRASVALETLMREGVLVKVAAALEDVPADQLADVVYLLCLFGREGVQRLAEILADEGRRDLHDAAADGLASLAKEAGPSIRRLIRSLPWRTGGKVAARMAASGDEEALRQVEEILRYGDWRVRRATLEALDDAGAHTIRLLIQALRDKDLDVRSVAVAHLANIREPSAVRPLQAVVCRGRASKDSQPLRERAVLALGRIGGPATEALEEIVVRRKWIGRKAAERLSLVAAGELGKIADEKARHALARAAQQTKGRARDACLEALASAESRVSGLAGRDT